MKKQLMSLGAVLLIAGSVQAQSKKISLRFDKSGTGAERAYTVVSNLEGARYQLEAYDVAGKILNTSETNSITVAPDYTTKMVVTAKITTATGVHKMLFQDTFTQPAIQSNITAVDPNSAKGSPVVLVPDGVNAFSGSGFSIGPNPATDNLQINLGSSASKVTATLSNTAGQVVMQEVISGNNATLSVSQLPAGMYLLQLKSGKEVRTEKVQIQH